jgi:lipid II:glycine glycyltransferase (peptidoglycan interpeptide bridge formation enzyme)
MKIIRELDERRWREFVDNHPDGNVFHTPEMFQVFARARGHHPTLWAAEDGGRVQALMLPVEITVLDGLLKGLTSRAVVYGSVLAAPGDGGQQALAHLLDAYTEAIGSRVLFTELRNVSDLSALQPVLTEHGFKYQEHLNYLIDLDRTPDAILESFGRRTRKQIRRGLRSGEVAVTELTEREELADWYELIRQTYERAQVPLAGITLFEAAIDILRPKGMVRFVLARVGQTPAAASVELINKDVVYGWYGGVARDFGSYVPGEMVMWDVLCWGAENGYRVYDFGGAGTPDEDYGVRDFKAKFGGTLVGYGRNTYVHAPVRLPVSKVGYQVYRRVMGRIPARTGT